MEQIVLAVIIAVLGSNGMWAFIQTRLARKDTQADRLKTIETSIDNLSKKIDRNQAVLSRTHILRFSDEIQNGMHHSQEYFRQQMDDIDTYDQFCNGHPDFRNSYTVSASKHIKTTYDRLLEKGEFKI